MTGTFEFEKGDKRDVPDFNVFFNHNATYPFYSDAIWFLTQMRRWGQIAESPDDAWYEATAKSVYRPDIYEQAAQLLVDEGKIEAAAVLIGADGYKPANADFIDGIAYDPKQPSAYVDSLTIGLKTGEANVAAG
jgi:nitrate/nitrite transport system substrate-binding protein